MTAYSTNNYGAVVYPSTSTEAPFISSTLRASYFKVSEFKCKDTAATEIWINPQLAAALEKLRTNYFARAMKIRSGYRTQSYNDGLGGNGTAPNSEHMYGTAADIEPSSRNGWTTSGRQWVTDAISIYRNRSTYGLHGVGVYDYSGSDTANSYIHVDVGPGSNAPSLISNRSREARPSFWYQWIRNPSDGQAYAIYLYESAKITNLLNNLQPGGGDPRSYISGLTGGQTIVAVQGEDSGSSDYSPTFTDYRGRTKLLQLYLKFKGYYSSTIDGVYGNGTANGVKQFQTANGLTSDGVIVWNSGNTFPKMFPTLRRGQKDTDSTAMTRNENIKFLQKLLVEQFGKTSVGTPDGIFGSNTETAVKALQGSGADGIVGPATWDLFAGLL